MIRLYIDCNILIDWLMDREPYSYYAAKIIELTEKKQIESYVSALILANTYYIISKEVNKKIADEFLKDAKKLFNFADMTKNGVKRSIEKRYKDFEDDLHYHTAIENELEYIVTRNGKDFQKEGIEVIDAEGFIEKYKQKEEAR